MSSQNNNEAKLYRDLLAHDINNVLNSIRSSVNLYYLTQKEPIEMEQIDEIMSVINEQTIRGANLVRNVLKLSQLEGDSPLIHPIDACLLLKTAIQNVRNEFQSKNLKIDIISSKQRDLYVQGNELLIDVFENILINAMKYNKSSEIEIIIKISEEKRDNTKYIKIEFLDNGIGIRDSKKQIIFKPIYGTNIGLKGIGIGLSLVKKLLEMYRGEIWVEDKIKGEHSKGSNFVVLIPKLSAL